VILVWSERSRVHPAPSSRLSVATGALRSIVVEERRPICVPIEHELAPSGKYRLSFGSE
jgi:hypothetical protein